MSTRCGCRDDGDEAVFGPCRTCHPEPEGVAAADLQLELDRLEHPYESVLHDDVPGDLG